MSDAQRGLASSRQPVSPRGRPPRSLRSLLVRVMALSLVPLTVATVAGLAVAPGGASQAPSPTDCVGKGVLPAANAAQPPDGEQSLEWQIGQMLMAGVAGTALSADASHVIGDLHVGNVVLMGPNVESPSESAARIVASARLATRKPLWAKLSAAVPDIGAVVLVAATRFR